MNTDDYYKQGTNFLKKTKTAFTVKYLKTNKYFPDDNAERDIYEVTLSHNGRSWTFTFGNSVAASGRYILNETGAKVHDHKGQSHRKNPSFEEPTPYSVLACIDKNNPGTFEEFCHEFRHDTDSKKAEKLYQAVKESWLNCERLFNEEELEQLREIQ